MKLLLGLKSVLRWPRSSSTDTEPIPISSRAGGTSVGVVAQDDTAARGLDCRQHRLLRTRISIWSASSRCDGGPGPRGHQPHADADTLHSRRRYGLDPFGWAASARAPCTRTLSAAENSHSRTKARQNLDEHNVTLIADLIKDMPITRIVVAHRPALIQRAHKIFVVGGRRVMSLEEIRRMQEAAEAAEGAGPLEPSRRSRPLTRPLTRPAPQPRLTVPTAATTARTTRPDPPGRAAVPHGVVPPLEEGS